jgi:hypothetical protein
VQKFSIPEVFTDFSNKINAHLNEEYGSLFGDNIIILKKVKSVRRLKNTEKKWTRLCYKEVILKGFIVIKDNQCYTASKTNIWIERTGIEYLKKSEEEEIRSGITTWLRTTLPMLGSIERPLVN